MGKFFLNTVLRKYVESQDILKRHVLFLENSLFDYTQMNIAHLLLPQPNMTSIGKDAIALKRHSGHHLLVITGLLSDSG